MTTTDSVVLFLLIAFYFSGWKNGLLRSLIGPFSFGVCAIVGLIHYDLSHNIAKSLVITFLGTAILSIAANIIFLIIRSSVDKKYRDSAFVGSRLSGGLLSLLWKGALLAILILLSTFVPPFLPQIDKAQKDIKKSASFILLTQHVIGRVPLANNILETLAVFRDPQRIKRLSSSPEYLEFFNDQKIQDLTSDPAILDQINQKDFADLLSNPKVVNLLRDDELMAKLSRLSKKIYQERLKEEAAEVKPSP